jgi:hypothetical protein
MQGWNAWDASSIWSVLLIAITTTIHAGGVVLIVMAISRIERALVRRGRPLVESGVGAVALIVGVALSLVVLHGIECLAWAFAYVHLGALPNPADATLYSVDSMTTRGASGLVVEREWRMMGAAEAGNGMLLFGVSTAFLFYIMQRLWKTESSGR